VDSTLLDSLLARLLAHPSNAALLAFLNIAREPTPRFVPWGDDSVTAAYDEGGRIFFGYASALPPNTKYSLSTFNLLVLPDSGLVFGVHYGRCTFFHRCDFARTGISNSDHLRVAVTLDAQIDITSLGADWAILNGFAEDEPDQLLWSYELSRGIGGSSVA
jgi:hypothetical protein